MPPILVDAFGTIVEPRPPWLEMREVCFREAIDGTGLDYLRFQAAYSEERRHDHERPPGDWREFDFVDRFRRTYRRLGLGDAETWARTSAERYHEFQARLVAPLADAQEGLAALARLGPLALVSNYPHGPTLVSALERLGLASYFRAHVVSADIGWLKPHAAPFLEAAKRLGGDPHECVVVGNDPHDDLGGARALHMRCVLVAYPRGIAHPVPEGALGVAGDLPEAAMILRDFLHR